MKKLRVTSDYKRFVTKKYAFPTEVSRARDVETSSPWNHSQCQHLPAATWRVTHVNPTVIALID